MKRRAFSRPLFRGEAGGLTFDDGEAGLTLREYYIGQAIAGAAGRLLSDDPTAVVPALHPTEIAKQAVAIADEVLKLIGGEEAG